MMKRADLYFKDNKYYILGLNQLKNGRWVRSGKDAVCDVGEGGIFEKFQSILDSCEIGVESGIVNNIQQVLDLSGFQSWDRFSSGAKYVLIIQNGREMTFYATRQINADRFDFDKTLEVAGVAKSEVEFVKMLSESLSLCC